MGDVGGSRVFCPRLSPFCPPGDSCYLPSEQGKKLPFLWQQAPSCSRNPRPIGPPPSSLTWPSTGNASRSVYSGLSIHPKQWVKAEQRAQLRGYPANGLLNDALDLLEEKLLASYAERRATGDTPTTSVLRTLSQPTVEPKPTPGAAQQLSFWDYYEEWVALARGHGKARNAMVYETTARHLRAFAAQAKTTISFDSITPAFGDKFTLYLLDKAQLADNTIAKQVATLKRF